MNEMTLKELRELAKARGLKGFSKLTKDQLVRLLERRQSEPAAAKSAATRTKKSAGVERRHRKTPLVESIEAAPSPPATTGATSEPPAAPAPRAVSAEAAAPMPHKQFASPEEEVEDAKYALRPNGRPATAAPTDLNEDIDRLPALSDALVCLLAQKPGVLHAYWVLPPGETTARGGYKLRLCQSANDVLEVREEVSVQRDRGSWYFHLAELSGSAALLVQLGYYQDGKFLSAHGRSLARLPSLYASTHTDQRWWIEEADFMRMYIRAGGVVAPAEPFDAGRRLGWTASIGSPAGGPSSEQPMKWPGGVSSRAS